MAKDYTGLVEIYDDYINSTCGLKCKYNNGYLSKKEYDIELEKRITGFMDLLNDIKSRSVIASEVLSGKSTFEDIVRNNYKEVRDYVKSFEDFKNFKPNEKLDEQTKLLLRELYDSSEKKKIMNNPMLTENIKRFGEKSIFNFKRYDSIDGKTIVVGSLSACCGVYIFLAGGISISEIINEKLLGGFVTVAGSVVLLNGIDMNLEKSKFWNNPDMVLSRLNDESAAHVVRAGRFDEIYSILKE